MRWLEKGNFQKLTIQKKKKKNQAVYQINPNMCIVSYETVTMLTCLLFSNVKAILSSILPGWLKFRGCFSGSDSLLVDTWSCQRRWSLSAGALWAGFWVGYGQTRRNILLVHTTWNYHSEPGTGQGLMEFEPASETSSLSPNKNKQTQQNMIIESRNGQRSR